MFESGKERNSGNHADDIFLKFFTSYSLKHSISYKLQVRKKFPPPPRIQWDFVLFCFVKSTFQRKEYKEYASYNNGLIIIRFF